MTNFDEIPAPLAPGEPSSALTAPAPRIWGLWGTIFWGTGALILFAGVQLAGALIYFVWFNSLHPQKPIALTDIGTNGPLIAFVMLASVPFLVAFIAFAVKRSRTSFADYLALKWPRLGDVGIGLAGLTAVLVLSSIAASFTDEKTPSFMTGTFETGRDAGLLPLLAAALILAAPIGEEFLFRGFLFRGFYERLGAPIAILLTAVSWAILHIQYDWFFVAEIVSLGIFFGWMRWKSGSTLLTMMLHAINNGLALLALVADFS